MRTADEDEPGPVSLAVALACFAGGLVASTWLLRPGLPAGGPPDERVEIKLAHLAAHPDRYDTLFVGSSRTFRGFVPAEFDAVTAEAGVPTRSLNLGVPGNRALETQRVLERVRRIQPDGWRTVFVDPEGFEVLLDEGNYLARAVIDWHDLPTTLLVTEYIRANDEGSGAGSERRRAGTREKLRLHAVACAYNLTGVGRALPWVDRLLGIAPDPVWLAETIGPDADGYAPQQREQRKGFKRQAQDYLDRVGDLEDQNRALDPDAEPAPQPAETFRRIQERIEALGARAVFVAQPGMYLNRDLVLAAERGRIDTLLRFDQPSRFPELYALEARYDFNHLNPSGARRFSRALARAYVELEVGP